MMHHVHNLWDRLRIRTPAMVHSNETVATIHRLERQIDALADQHQKALQSAMYLGMTSDEAKECDERRTTINALMEQLTQLQNDQ